MFHGAHLPKDLHRASILVLTTLGAAELQIDARGRQTESAYENGLRNFRRGGFGLRRL